MPSCLTNLVKNRNYQTLGVLYIVLCIDGCILLSFDQLAHHWRWLVLLLLLDVLILLQAGAGAFLERWRLLIPSVFSRVLLLTVMLLFTLFTLNAVFGSDDPAHYLTSKKGQRLVDYKELTKGDEQGDHNLDWIRDHKGEREHYRREIAEHPYYILVGCASSVLLASQIVLFLYFWRSVTTRKRERSSHSRPKAFPSYFINFDEGHFSSEEKSPTVLRPERDLYGQQIIHDCRGLPLFVY